MSKGWGYGFEFYLSKGHSPQIRQNGELLVRMCRGESHFSQKWPLANVGESGEYSVNGSANVGESGEYSVVRSRGRVAVTKKKVNPDPGLKRRRLLV